MQLINGNLISRVSHGIYGWIYPRGPFMSNVCSEGANWHKPGREMWVRRLAKLRLTRPAAVKLS